MFANKLAIALRNFRKFMISVVIVKGYFLGYSTLYVQNQTVRGPRAVSDHCTIAQITVLLVALTAAKAGNKGKIRFTKSFLPNI